MILRETNVVGFSVDNHCICLVYNIFCEWTCFTRTLNPNIHVLTLLIVYWHTYIHIYFLKVDTNLTCTKEPYRILLPFPPACTWSVARHLIIIALFIGKTISHMRHFIVNMFTIVVVADVVIAVVIAVETAIYHIFSYCKGQKTRFN